MSANWFVALPVPADGWFARVGDPPSGVRRFHPSDLHLTVAFLGAVDAEAAARAFAVARALPLAPVQASLGAVVPMGGPRHFSALSARLQAGERAIADAIAAVRDGACVAAGARCDVRPVLPHLTVARLGRRATPAERREAVRWAAALDLTGVHVSIARVALYTWARDRASQLFECVADVALGEDPSRRA